MEKTNETPTNSTGGTAADAMASQPQRPGQPTGSLSPGDSDLHPELDGDGKRAGQPGTSGAIAQTTQPQDATRELNTATGPLPYSAVAERLAVNIAQFNPAADDEPTKANYFNALRSADNGDLVLLSGLWLERLTK